MENNNNNGRRDDENLRGQQENTSYERENVQDSGNDQKSATSGEDIAEGHETKHHQQHGNRHYESFSNHSSASDQPATTTDTNLGRDL